MSKVVNAIFENGVLKPLQKIDLKEHEQVELKILSHDEWQSGSTMSSGKSMPVLRNTPPKK